MIPHARRFYHGTRADLQPGDLIEPCRRPEAGDRDTAAFYVYLTPDLDEALWTAELSDGKGRGRVYVVKPIGPIEDVRQLTVRNRFQTIHPCHTVRANRYGSSTRLRRGRCTTVLGLTCSLAT